MTRRPSEWLTPGDAALCLGVSPSAIHRAVERHALEPRIVSRGGVRLFHVDDLLRFAAERLEPRRPRHTEPT